MSAPQFLTDGLAEKSSRIERCIARVREEYAAASAGFRNDFSRQDAALLNIQRACELAIDMGNMAISHEGWELPRSAREVFSILEHKSLIEAQLATALQHMVGFRNIAVHQYEKLDLDIVVSVIEREIDCLPRFAGILLSRYLSQP